MHFLAVAFFEVEFWVSCQNSLGNNVNDLTIFTYSSFNSEWGPGPKVFPLFEKKGINVLQSSLKLLLEDTGTTFGSFFLAESHKNVIFIFS